MLYDYLMQIILASAKIMNENIPLCSLPTHAPLFRHEAYTIARDLQQYDASTLSAMLNCSFDIARQNRERYAHFFETNEYMPAIMAYQGQAYKHLKAHELTQEQLCFADKHLWILSFLYGMLRPLDEIHSYRLEGNIFLESTGDMNVFDFWKSRLTQPLIDSVRQDDGILIHLATEEYQHLFDWKQMFGVRIIQPLFYVQTSSGLKMQAVWAKTCRGAMTRWLLKNPTLSPQDLVAFQYQGFQYSALHSSDDKPIFIKN